MRMYDRRWRRYRGGLGPGRGGARDFKASPFLPPARVHAAGAHPILPSMLHRIPIVDGTPLDLLRAQPEAGQMLLARARLVYTPAGLAVADRISRAWLARNRNPYLDEIDAVAAGLGQPGAHMLNLSYEWGCTTAVAADPAGAGMRLLRTLDWPLDGLGRHVVVLRATGPAGAWWSATWPGFAGALTAMAPGRFAGALNQAKAFHGRLGAALEWPVLRLRMLASAALPPSHLLRRACEEAADYAAAVRLLAETPICLPAFFTVAGPRPGEGCVIEREPNRAHIHPAPTTCANHWRFPGLKGARPTVASRWEARGAYGRTSAARARTMAERVDAGDFAWLQPPLLCPLTRLACAMSPAEGRMDLLGIEAMQPVTEIETVAEAASPPVGMAEAGKTG